MKRSRAYVREQRKRVIKNRKKLVRDSKLPDGNRVDGEYAKRHPFDCGKTDCMLCHGHKKNKACGSKWKDERGELEEIIKKEMREELRNTVEETGCPPTIYDELHDNI
jgi:hypothetical protein